jgi:hypothetical protein
VEALQLVGFGSFMVASLVLGMRLLALAVRTREAAEFLIGCAFVLAGFLGWGCFSAMPFVRAQGGDVEAVHAWLTAGLGFSLAGTLANGAGIVLVFRVGASAAWLALAALAAFQLGCFLAFLRVPAGQESLAFWGVLLGNLVVYAWTGIESYLLGDALRRRARLGLADPIVATRALLWAVASGATVVLIGAAIAARIVVGPGDVPGLRYFQSACGLVAAGAVWLAFFPPGALRRRVAAGAEA